MVIVNLVSSVWSWRGTIIVRGSKCVCMSPTIVKWRVDYVNQNKEVSETYSYTARLCIMSVKSCLFISILQYLERRAFYYHLTNNCKITDFVDQSRVSEACWYTPSFCTRPVTFQFFHNFNGRICICMWQLIVQWLVPKIGEVHWYTLRPVTFPFFYIFS